MCQGFLGASVAQPGMKFLFIHHSFPSQYWHIVRLLRDNGHEVVFITRPTDQQMHNVRKVDHDFDMAMNDDVHPGARHYDLALRRADAMARLASGLKKTGYRPDIILGHHGWGDLLNLQDVWPDVPLLGYFEFYYQSQEVNFDPEFDRGPYAWRWQRATNAVNHLALANPGMGQIPTEFQLSTYPPEFRKRITLIREGIDLSLFSPDPAIRNAPLPLAEVVRDPALRSAACIAPSEKLVTYINRFLEPCRGLHIMMRALPALLARKDVRVVVIGAEAEGYGPLPEDGRSWKQHFLDEMRGRYDAGRVHFVGVIDHDAYRRLLRRSDAHVYLSYPFVASWSLREALACGCAVVGSDTAPIAEFIRHGRNGLLAPFFDPRALSETILEVLEDDWLDGHIRDNARAYAERHLSMSKYLATYCKTIRTLTPPRSAQ